MVTEVDMIEAGALEVNITTHDGHVLIDLDVFEDGIARRPDDAIAFANGILRAANTLKQTDN